jgi:IPT/TIG domain
MKSGKRHIGRRVAGVAIGAALLMVGLEAPAFATHTVTGFTPASGPPGCVVVITGTDFNNPTVTDVDFNGTPATFEIISATTIWAEVPDGATNGPINVTNSLHTVSSAVGFTVTAGPGDCAPTIASFTPTCGPAGTDVTITGTNLLQSPTLGGNVRFAPYSANATPVVGAAVSPTEISVNVPAGAADGPIQVRIPGVTPPHAVSTGTFDAGTCITDFQPQSGDVGDTVTITGVGFEGATAVTFAGAGGTRVQAIFQVATDTATVDTITATVPVGAVTGTIRVESPGGTVTTATDFTVGAGPVNEHPRNVTLKLVKHLRMKGKVNVPDGFTDCASNVPVKLQRKKKGGGWKTLKTVTTNDTGQYSSRVNDKAGRYRAVAPRTTVGDEICLKDVSPVRKHSH